MLNTKNIKFSIIDLKRNIKLPKKMSPKLAELIGIIMGDGNIYTKDRFELSIFGDIKEDKEYHEKFISKLFKDLFNLDVESKEKHYKTSNCRKIYIRSKAIVSFLTNIIGIKAGRKENAKVPETILKSDRKIICHFLRGLADTDFSIRFKTRYKHKNYYPTIIGNLSDKQFVYRLKSLLEKIEFHSHIDLRKKYDKKRKKYYFTYALNIVGHKNFEKWMQEVGFRNKRHLIRYNVWKIKGFCPPYTNIEKGEQILKEHGVKTKQKLSCKDLTFIICYTFLVTLNSML